MVALFAKTIIFFSLLLRLQSPCRPLLLLMLGSIFQLQIFVESHHILDIILDDLGKDILLQELARLHGIKKEILAEFLRQICLDNLIHLLLVDGTLLRRRSRAIGERRAIHIEQHILHRLVGRIKLISATQQILLLASEHHTFEREFEHDGRLHLSQGTIVQEFLKMRLVLNLESIESPTDSLEQRGLTTTVHTTYQDDGLIGSHRQIQVKTQISLIVLDFDSFDNHNLFFTLRSSFLVLYLI